MDILQLFNKLGETLYMRTIVQAEEPFGNAQRKARWQLMKRNIALLVMLLIGSTPTWAALGNNAASVDADAQAWGGQHTVVAKAGYNLHQITLADGSVVNEFVSPAGVVFGVSWKGRRLPDFHQLFGVYVSNFQQGQRTQVIPRRAVTIQGTDFYFTNFGRMMSFHGRAYAPSLIPANLTAEVVQ